jgi:arylsulfatase A-like enzyme
MQSRRPHVLVITCHDLGQHLGCYGIDTVQSPNLDGLAKTGVRFGRAFCTAPQCSPSRASLATGRYPHNHGVLGLAHRGYDWDLDPGERHAAALLAENGYETHLFGHQHVTQDVDRLGFQHLHALGPGQADGASPAGSRDVAAAFEMLLQASPMSAPLYMEINFFEPHRPYDFDGIEPDTSKGVFVPGYLPQTAEATKEMAALQGAIREVDLAAGRVLAAVDRAGFADRTLVVFSADHGLAMPRAKCTLYDPGIAIALILRWPEGGLHSGTTPSGLVSNVDVLPTILEAASIPIPEQVQGDSLLHSGVEAETRRDAIFAEKTFHSYYDPMRCIRTHRFKYIRNFETAFGVEVPGDVQRGAIFRADPGRYAIDRQHSVELYDLIVDPFEQENLAGSPGLADIERHLDRRLWRWMEETQDPLLQGPIPSPRFRVALEDRPPSQMQK